MIAYRWRRTDIDGPWSHPFTLRKIVRVVVDRAARWGPVYHLRTTDGIWGPDLHRVSLTTKLRHHLTNASVGDVWLVDTQDHQGGQLAVRTFDIPDPVGKRVVEAARSQLGVPYVWGAAAPGSGFDCSGLTSWAIDDATSGAVVLPHNAEAQRTDYRVREFAAPSGAEVGDLVFYHTGRLAPGVADHVGIYAGLGRVIDASSGLDRVVERPVASNPVMSYGKVRGVNG